MNILEESEGKINREVAEFILAAVRQAIARTMMDDVEFKFGTAKYDEGNVHWTITFKPKREGEQLDEHAQKIADIWGFEKLESASYKLIDYDKRKRKMPFIFVDKQTGNRIKAAKGFAYNELGKKPGHIETYM